MNRSVMIPKAFGYVVLGALLALVPLASAQPGATGPEVQTSIAGIDYLNGGAGEEERTAMSGRQGEFPLKLVFSSASGEYIVADRLGVRSAKDELLGINDAGPLVMVKLPPGRYTLKASFDGRTETRTVDVTRAAQTVNWRVKG